MAQSPPTRQRLVEAGMKLFAERGFDATSVGDIEAEAGLKPRRGGLYKHFESKHELLEQAFRRHLDDAAAAATALVDPDPASTPTPGDELRPIVEEVGRQFLSEMDRMENLTRVLEHDGSRLAGVTAEAKHDIVDLSYRVATAIIVAVAPAARDPEAVAVVLLGSLVALRRTTWTFGSAPLGIDDDRALAAWVEVTLATLDALSIELLPDRDV